MNVQLTKEDFLQLIDANKGIIIKICHSYCADKNYHEDLAQEIIYQLWKSGKSFQKGYKFSTWMYRIALNVAISFYRKEKNKNAFLTNTELPENHEDKSTDTTETESNINRLQLLINEMPALDKALMILYLESKAYAEIAEILGITETNVATKLSRIKSRLKKQLSTQNS
jgi:RNA polymerase sigma-70 factor (ECF subfamily)